jgi:hypothetical protein
VGIFDSIAKGMFGLVTTKIKLRLSHIENASDQTPDELKLVSHVRETLTIADSPQLALRKRAFALQTRHIF